MSLKSSSYKSSLQVILLFGVVSLCGDLIYESARSINGQYLKIIGANAVAVGAIAGLGEFLGYAIRLLSGYLSDKTGSYWVFTFIGYFLLCSVPFLAFTNTWQVAIIFILLERFGKAIRSPAKDTIISQASKDVGRGFGFGIHEAMDQIGALGGPLILSFVFLLKGTYKTAYSILWIPFVLVMLAVIVAYFKYSSLQKVQSPERSFLSQKENTGKIFWLYNLFTFFAVMGFPGFALLGYHFKTTGIMTDAQIPFFYAVAMAVDAAVAIIAGKLYDKYGIVTLSIIPFATLLIPLLVFTGSNLLAITTGIILWGIVMGIHETTMRAAIADLTELKKRGTGYGIFNTSYGIAWFIGSALIGYFYDKNRSLILIFSILTQIISLLLFLSFYSLPKKNRVVRE
ncbi:MAG: MFS transporter [Chitinispirillaceae bacterium]|nr:MFS transporter [Chitinispirillaceae bacterium]